MEEWEAAFYAYRAAQARMATASAYLSLLNWEQAVAVGSAVATSASWARYTVKVVRAFRSRSRGLTQAYLQYVRALEIQAPGGPPLNGGDATRLETYRQTFFDALQDAATMGTGTPSSWPEDADWDFVDGELRMVDPSGVSENARSASFTEIDLDRHLQEFLDAWGPDMEVSVEDFEWPPLEGTANDAAHERHFRELVRLAEAEIEKNLRARDANAEDEEEDANERRRRERAEERNEHMDAGNRLAGQVMAATSHAADQVMNSVIQRDGKVRAVARGTSATPCAFCAMLASRGFVYKLDSFGSGNASIQFRKVHPNCQCYPIIRYVDADVLPELNRRFRDLWDASQLPGQKTFNVFRRALYEEQKDRINQRRRRRRQDRKFESEWQRAGAR